MRAYVTGGLGFIGSRVIERLCQNDIPTICVDYRERLGTMTAAGLPICGRIMRALARCEDVMEPEYFLNAVHERAPNDDVLIHLGAVVDTSCSDQSIFRDNIDFMRSVIPHFRKIVFASSGAVYGNHGHPDVVYGLTKAIGERMLAAASGMTRAISLRFMNVYGEDEHHKGAMASMPFKMALAVKQRTELKLFSLDDRRDFVHADDVASAVIAAAAELGNRDGRHHSIYDVGTGFPTKFRDLYSYVRVPEEESLMRLVDMPSHLVGKYQRYTCAGMMMHGIENIFDQDWYKGRSPILVDEGARAVRDML